MINSFTDEPLHDPAAEVLGVKRHEVSVEDRERFMQTVWLAMEVLNRHPLTETENEPGLEGKPINKHLTDTVELPAGEAALTIQTGFREYDATGIHPITIFTLEYKFKPAAQRITFNGSGRLFVEYATTAEELDTSSTDWFQTHVDEIPESRGVAEDYDSDWDHFEDIEAAVQALHDQLPPRTR